MYLKSPGLVKRFRVRVTAIASFALVGVSGCVQPERVEVLEREQRRIQSDNVNQQKEIDATRASLADTRANLQQVEREISSLKELIEETRHQVGRQIDHTSREGDQRVKDLEARLGKLAEGFKAQGEQLKLREDELKEVRKGLQLPPEATEMASAENETIRRDYEVAWRNLEKRDYRIAIARFKDFQKKHPKSSLAANAQYWIGESHYALREFDQAVIEFDAVRTKHPEAANVPAALLKQAYAFAELGENTNARLLLQEVVEKYAQTPEATQAKQKLKSLES
ncbi:MAG TPA: tol-pal system protein YbgF [Candidatus Binatia bacterium]